MTFDEARVWAADICAHSEQCSFDIRKKLLNKGLPLSQINEIIEFLVAERFLDDSRFARAFASDKVRFSGWGRNKIRYALAMKHIPQSVISEALDAIDRQDYLDAAKRVARQKIKELNIFEPADRQKFYRHLMQRGFESELVGKLLNTATKRLKDGGGQ